MGAALKDDQGNRRDDGHASDIKKALENPYTEDIGDGMLGALGKKQGTDWFAGSAQQKDRSKAGKRGRIDLPELGAAEVALENLPAKRAQRVTGIDKNHAGGEPQRISSPDGGP